MKDYSANYDTPQQDITTAKEFSQCLSDKVPFRWEVQGHCAEGVWEKAPTNGMVFAVEFSRENDLISRTAGIYTVNQELWWPGSFEHMPDAIRMPFWDEIWNKVSDDNYLTNAVNFLNGVRKGTVILAITKKSPG